MLGFSVNRTWTSSVFSTNESAWIIMVTGSQSHVWSGPSLTYTVRLDLTPHNDQDIAWRVCSWTGDKLQGLIINPLWDVSLSFVSSFMAKLWAHPNELILGFPSRHTTHGVCTPCTIHSKITTKNTYECSSFICRPWTRDAKLRFVEYTKVLKRKFA